MDLAKCCRCVIVLALAAAAHAADEGAFQRRWVYVSETSAVIYWQLDDIRQQAASFVEYGDTPALGARTAPTPHPRWAQFHRLTGLESGKTYHHRMVNLRPDGAQQSEPRSFTTRRHAEAICVPQQVNGPPFVLDKQGATYLLTQDVRADAEAFVITAPDVTLDLDGHTVVFGDDTDQQVFGVQARNPGKATVCNGHIVQGRRSGPYSSCVESRRRPEPLEVFGVSTDVHLKCSYPLRAFGAAAGVHVHHNHLYSRCTELESRHYPGNDLLRLDIKGGDIHVHDNLLTEGCHIGMRLSGEGPNVEIEYNDIRHHQQYVNGYALAAACPGLDIHHNRVTSCGRGVHLTADGIRLHDNYLDIRGHQQLDDIPAKTRPFKHQIVEVHGIKFEGTKATRCKVHGNVMRILQTLPRDSDGQGRPEDKIESGVYVRGKASAIAPDRLVDATQSWEKDRWRDYYVKYLPALPPARITGNDATTLFGEFKSAAAAEYAIYQKWNYAPATPLNIACYDPNAMNEVFDNTFVALTAFEKTRHGGYGQSGQWAAAIYFVGMDRGPADEGRHAIHVHDNTFISNHLFVASYSPVTMTVRIEGNTFTLADDPAPAEGRQAFRRIGPELEQRIRGAGNVFRGMQP